MKRCKKCGKLKMFWKYNKGNCICKECREEQKERYSSMPCITLIHRCTGEILTCDQTALDMMIKNGTAKDYDDASRISVHEWMTSKTKNGVDGNDAYTVSELRKKLEAWECKGYGQYECRMYHNNDTVPVTQVSLDRFGDYNDDEYILIN